MGGGKEIESFMETVFSTLISEDEIFLGTIQLNIPDKNKKYYEIIDGQQRITTIVLLVDFLEKASGRAIEKYIDLVYENIESANNVLTNIKTAKLTRLHRTINIHKIKIQ